MQSSATQSFFFWLDHGEGKDLDLPDVSRKELDGQRLRYCTKQERKQYATEIGSDKLLHFLHNGALVHTLSAEEQQETDTNFEQWKHEEVRAGRVLHLLCVKWLVKNHKASKSKRK